MNAYRQLKIVGLALFLLFAMSEAKDIQIDKSGLDIVHYPKHGKLVLKKTGKLVYVMDDSFEGSDKMTYRQSTGNLGSRTVDIIIDDWVVLKSDTRKQENFAVSDNKKDDLVDDELTFRLNNSDDIIIEDEVLGYTSVDRGNKNDIIIDDWVMLKTGSSADKNNKNPKNKDFVIDDWVILKTGSSANKDNHEDIIIDDWVLL